MSVLTVSENWPQRSGSFGTVSDSRLTRHWLVKTDSKWDNAVTIRDHFRDVLGIEYLTPHPSNIFFTLRNLQCDPLDDTPIAWNVTGIYSTAPLDDDEQDQQIDNPLLRPTIIEWNSEISQEFTTKDKDGKPMLNSAGDALEPIEKDDVRWVISLTRNFASIPFWVAEYTNTVNSAAVAVQGQTLAARTLKLQRLHISPLQVENDIPFYQVNCELAYKPDTWDVDRLDEGFHYLDGSDRKKILLDDGESPSEPVPLDGSGGILANPDPDNAVYQTKKIYSEKDHNNLPF